MTRMKFAFACLMLALLAMPQIGFAQQTARSLERLSELNRINPLQNPEYVRSDDVLTRKIIDRKNKVIGEVKDITLRNNGTIDTIATNFDRLRLGDTVYLDFRQMSIRPVTNAYSLAMASEEVVDFYPQLLANIATASGEEDGAFSSKKIIGSNIYAQDGRNIGHVHQIMFGSNGTLASALLVEVNIGTTRGDYVAVPFRMTELSSKSGKLQGTVTNDLADAIIEVAKN